MGSVRNKAANAHSLILAMPRSLVRFWEIMILLMAWSGFLTFPASPFQRCKTLYLLQIPNTSWAKPLLKFSKLALLCSSSLWGNVPGVPLRIRQKYLILSNSNRQARGSTPQKRRTVAGDTARGQLISFFRICVCKCSSFRTNPASASDGCRQ